MAHKSYRAESRKDWGSSQEGSLTGDQIRTGALLRIADATEAMSKNHQALIDERDSYKRLYESAVRREDELIRRNRSLRGVITKLRKAMNARATEGESNG